MRKGAFGWLLLAARAAVAFFSGFLGASLRLGAVTLLCNFLDAGALAGAIFFDFSTVVFDAFSALGGETDFLGAAALAWD